jgi:integrase
VFPAKGGERRSRNARISEVFARILARAGVARPFRFYDLRHTSATLHRLAGADPLVIRLMLGHASRNLTDDLYSHLSIDYQKTELAKLCVCGACARS